MFCFFVKVPYNMPPSIDAPTTYTGGKLKNPINNTTAIGIAMVL